MNQLNSTESVSALLDERIGQLQQRNLIILTFANESYQRQVLNWAQGMARCRVRNYLVIALDQTTHDFLLQHGIPTVLLPFGGTDRHTISPFRFNVLTEILNLGYDLIHSDADAFWIKDPIPEYFTDSSYDMMFSQGTAFPRSVFRQWGFVLCTGFYWSRSNDRTRLVMAALNEAVQQLNFGDQRALNEYFGEDRHQLEWHPEESDSYLLEIARKNIRIMCSRVPIRGDFSSPDLGNGLTIKIGVLPHHHFQRRHQAAEEAYVKHILFDDDYRSLHDMFVQTGCWFLES